MVDQAAVWVWADDLDGFGRASAQSAVAYAREFGTVHESIAAHAVNLGDTLGEYAVSPAGVMVASVAFYQEVGRLLGAHR